MPSVAAFLAFDPASAPATKKSVLADTDPETLAPSDSALALASARDIFSRCAGEHHDLSRYKAVINWAFWGQNSHHVKQVLYI